MSVKINRAIASGHWHKGPETTKAIMSQVPPEVIEQCPSRIIAAVADAINGAYHNGRAAAEKEVEEGA